MTGLVWRGSMRIRLAGLVTIEHNDAPRHLSSAQAQVAFARLTLDRASGTGRDQLADTIWPEGLPNTWASALRSVVSRVRAFVACTQTPGEPPLVAQGGLYLLRLPADVSVDLECAERAVGEALEAFAADSFADAQRLAASAVSCLQGPFLPDHEGEWVSSVRDRVGELLLSGLETASLAASALGDERNALRFADEAVRHAPLRESAYRCRMNAHFAAGNRAEALRSYHQLQRILADELGIDPAQETQEAYVDLLGSHMAPAGRTGSQSRPRPHSAAPFLGRQAELATLANAWSRAEHGAGQMILIVGESGIGKTRLVTEAARRISLAGGLVMYGRCDRESSTPCQPFVEALGGFVAATPDDSMPKLSDATRETLAELLPEPTHRLAERASSKRAELRHALSDLLRRVARDRPVFLVLDDIDVADDDTFLLLRQVFRCRSGTSLLVVATAGISAAHSDHFMATVWDLQREGWLHRVALHGLKGSEVATLRRQVLPETSADDAPSTHPSVADTTGNAYLLRGLLRFNDLLIRVATAINDANVQIVAAHHRALAAEPASDFSDRRHAVAALASR